MSHPRCWLWFGHLNFLCSFTAGVALLLVCWELGAAACAFVLLVWSNFLALLLLLLHMLMGCIQAVAVDEVNAGAAAIVAGRFGCSRQLISSLVSVADGCFPFSLAFFVAWEPLRARRLSRSCRLQMVL